MKKRLFALLCCVISCFAVCFTACNKEPEKTTYTLTFRQEGCADIVKELNIGETLSDIPAPVEQDGYEIVWSITNFADLSKDTVITAIYTPREYRIYFHLNRDDVRPPVNANVAYDETKYMYYTSIKYSATADLFAPTSQYARFIKWENVETGEVYNGGKYLFTEDLYVRAVWEPTDTPYV